MKTKPQPSSRLVTLAGAKRLTRGFGVAYLEINVGRQDKPA